MKERLDYKVDRILAKLAYKTAEKQANIVCTLFFYQDKLPEKVKELRKF